MLNRSTLRRGVAALCLTLSPLLVVACTDSPGTGQASQTAAPASATGGQATPAPAPVQPTPTDRADPAPAVTAAPTTGGPQISFAKETHDFGWISDTKEYQTSYPFTNTGDQVLRILSVKAGCGCTVPTLEKYEYAPGESGQIDVVFKPKAMQGNKPKDVTVVTNSVRRQTIVLSFTSAIKPLLALQSRFLQMGELTLGQESKARMWATYTDPDLDITRVWVNKDFIDAKVVEMGAVQHQAPGGDTTYRATIEVTVSADAPWGTFNGARLFIELQGQVEEDAQAIDYDYEVYVQGSVYGELEAQSLSRVAGRQPTATSTISLGALEPASNYESSMRLRSKSGEPFLVYGASVAECNIPGMEVRVEPESPSSYQVYVSGNTGSFSGTIACALLVRTDVPGEEELTINVLGGVNLGRGRR